jgi:hypothetical protein
MGPASRGQKRKVEEWDEKAQKQFVDRYLSLYVAEAFDYSDQQPEDAKLLFKEIGAAANDAMKLVRMHSWAVDLYVERIKAIRKEPDGGIFRATALIAELYHSGRPDVLEIVSDRLQDDPEFPDLVKSLLVSSIGSPHPGEFNVWTRALQSNHPTVRKTMQEFVVAVCTSGHGPQWDLIVAGIVDRYGHSPNALEMASDPVFQAIAAGDARRAAEVKSRLLSSTEKEHLRRQVGPSVVRK